MKLDVAAAARAPSASTSPSRWASTSSTRAGGILRIAVTSMSYAVKARVHRARPRRARRSPLIAYGGAGPLHASRIAREIGSQRVIVPRAPGHFCAFGMLYSDLRYDYVRTWFTRLDDAPFDRDRAHLRRLIAQGRRRSQTSGIKPPSVTSPTRRTCATSARSTRSPSTCRPRSFKKRDREAIKKHFRRGAPAALRHRAPDERAEIVSLRATVPA